MKHMTYDITVHPRERGSNSRRLLRQGFIPGVVYGPGFKNRLLSLPAKEFLKVFQEAGESQVIALDVEGKPVSVLVHDIQRDPLSHTITHVDFYHITKGQKVRAVVPLSFTGVATGVKEKGGTLLTMLREVEVESLPEGLPSTFEVDVSVLKEFGDEITVDNIPLAEGVSILTPSDSIVASLTAPTRPEEEAKPQVEEEKPTQAPTEDEGESKNLLNTL